MSSYFLIHGAVHKLRYAFLAIFLTPPSPLLRGSYASPRPLPPPCYANENRNVKNFTVFTLNEIHVPDIIVHSYRSIKVTLSHT